MYARFALPVAVSVACACSAGCKRDRSSSEAQDISTAKALETYCNGGPCRRYEDAVAKLEALARRGSYCMTAETGSCGQFRFVSHNNGFVGYTEYFGKSGADRLRHRIPSTA